MGKVSRSVRRDSSSGRIVGRPGGSCNVRGPLERRTESDPELRARWHPDRRPHEQSVPVAQRPAADRCLAAHDPAGVPDLGCEREHQYRPGVRRWSAARRAPAMPQHDPRFGDIRIGAQPMDPGTLSISVPNDPLISSTLSGDVLINSDLNFSNGSHNLFTARLARGRPCFRHR